MPNPPSSQEIRALVETFPTVFEKAVADLARYKLALQKNLVRPEDQETISKWFYEFPQLWNLVRPNWEETVEGRAPTPEKLAFANNVNRWIIRLRGESAIKAPNSLGVVFVILAGVALVTALIGSVGWAIGHVKKQDNISALIDAAIAGKIPWSEVRDAMQADQGSFLDPITKPLGNVLLIGGLAVAAFFLLPMLRARRA